MNPDSLLDWIVRSTSGFLYRDLVELVDRAVWSCSKRFTKLHPNLPTELFHETSKLDISDFKEGLKHFDQIMSGAIGAPRIPEVRWEDVGKHLTTILFISSSFNDGVFFFQEDLSLRKGRSWRPFNCPCPIPICLQPE